MTRRLIFRLVIAVATLGALSAGWWAYWQAAADQVLVALEDWSAQERALGRTVDFDMPVFSGFPFAIRAEIAAPSYAMPTHGVAWQGPTIHASASPFDPLTVTMHAPGEHLVVRLIGSSRSDLAVVAGTLDGTLDFGRSNLQSLALSGSGIRASDSKGNVATLDAFAISLVPAASPPESHNDRLLGFDISLDWLTLPPVGLPLGDRIDAIDIRGRVMGPIPPGEIAPALDIWRKGGGTLEIDNASGRWGPLRFEGDGTLALDETLQPQGAAAVTLKGYEPTIDALVAGGYLTAQQGAATKTMLSAFAREPSDGGLKEVRLPLTLQNRKLSLGPLEFAELPAFDWWAR